MIAAMPAPTKYFDIKEKIRARTGEMAIGAKIPTIQHLHKEYGVSQGTIIRAIQELVDDGLLEHRQNRGAFVAAPGHATRNLRVVWPDITDLISRAPLSRHSLTGTFIHVLQREAAKRGRDLLITPGGSEPDGGVADAAGTLVMFGYDAEEAKAYREAGGPVVVVGAMIAVPGVPSVRTDDHGSVVAATELLIGKGHERILHLTIDDHLAFPAWPEAPAHVRNFYPRERERGYRTAMEHGGLGNLSLVHRTPNVGWSAADEDGVIALIREKQITACTCFNDDVAVRLLHACQKAGLSIPNDIAIIGFDDLGVALHTRPMLSSVAIPVEGIGVAAVELLDDIIEQRQDTSRSIVVDSVIHEREST